MFMTFSRARCIIITVALTLRGLQIPSVEQVRDRKAKTEVVAKDVPGKGRREHLIVTSLGRMRPPKSYARAPQTQWQTKFKVDTKQIKKNQSRSCLYRSSGASQPFQGCWQFLKKALEVETWLKEESLLTGLDCIRDCACTASPAAPRMPTLNDPKWIMKVTIKQRGRTG